MRQDEDATAAAAPGVGKRGEAAATSRRRLVILIGVFLLPVLVAVLNASGHIAGANDSSRLAAIDAIVEHHTLSIDQSKFNWSVDRMFVNGHYYSDKPLVPAIFLAAVAQVAKWVAHIDAENRNLAFVYLMTLANSGLAYVVAVWAFVLLLRERVSGGTAVALGLSFALGSLAPVYVQNMNSSIVVLAAGMCAALVMMRLRRETLAGRAPSLKWPALLGLIASVDYASEVASGAVLLILLGAYVAYRSAWSPKALLVFGLAAAPLILAHHLLNYLVAGTLGPANANPEVFNYPGSEIDPATITGVWSHPDFAAFVRYAGNLLIGPRGVVVYTPVMALAAAGLWHLRGTGLRRGSPGDAGRDVARLEMLLLTCWAGAVWIVYAALSSDEGGSSASIRWLVPALAPTYLILAELLRVQPRFMTDFLLLASGQVVATAIAWKTGPLTSPPAHLVWPIGMVTLACWAALFIVRQMRSRHASP